MSHETTKVGLDVSGYRVLEADKEAREAGTSAGQGRAPACSGGDAEVSALPCSATRYVQYVLVLLRTLSMYSTCICAYATCAHMRVHMRQHHVRLTEICQDWSSTSTYLYCTSGVPLPVRCQHEYAKPQLPSAIRYKLGPCPTPMCPVQSGACTRSSAVCCLLSAICCRVIEQASNFPGALNLSLLF